MTLNTYVREQLIDFTEHYRKYLKQTFGVALLLSLICFIIEAVLLRFSDFDASVKSKPISLLSYLFHFYSKGDTYSIVDLTKSVFVFFVAVFSLGMGRQTEAMPEDKRFSFIRFISKLNGGVVYLTGMLIITAIVDFFLFRLDSNLEIKLGHNSNSAIFVHDILFNLRIYIPLIFFSLVLAKLFHSIKSTLTIKRILLLYVSLWLFNEFSYEADLWVRAHVFNLLLIPFSDYKTFYLLESICGIPLFACFFVGYKSAMVNSLVISDLAGDAKKGENL